MNEAMIQKMRGIAIMLGGIGLLLYNFGFLQQLGTTVLALFSLFLIVAGFFDAGFYNKVAKMTQTQNKEH